MNKEKIIIIGNGIAGLSAAEAARKNNEDAYICIISNETYLTYYRLRLFDLIKDDNNLNSLYIHQQEWYHNKNIDLILGKCVKSIDTKNQIIFLNPDEKIEYTKLIIASGSSSLRPDISGKDKTGTFTLRSIDDIRIINNRLETAKSVVIVGGGLLGLEAAYQISKKNKLVTIIEFFPRLLAKQLDDKGAEVFENIVTNCGIRVKTNASVLTITGDEKVKGVLLKSGEELKADAVIFSIGISPRVEIIHDTIIEVNRGIIVDNKMKTNIKNIFAAGDVAEYDGKIYGLWSVAMNQGKTAGTNASGGAVKYNEETQPYFLNSMGTRVYSIGDVGKNDIEYDNLEYIDEIKNIYNNLYFINGILVGAVLIGDVSRSSKLISAVKNKYTKDQVLKDNLYVLK